MFLLLLIPVLLNAFWCCSDNLSIKAKAAKEALQPFDPLIKQALSDFDVPGLAIGFVVDGHVVYATGFGYRDVERKLPVTKDTFFPIGSCTKGFTSLGLGMLCDLGLMHWDQKVTHILPEFQLSDHYATMNITFRDLVTHRSGLPRHEFFWYNAKNSKEEMMRRLRFLEPSCGLRERYQYGNLSYFIAGVAMEKITGKNWEEWIKETILTPLNMKKTNFSVADLQKMDNIAFPYLEKKKRIPFRNLSSIASAGAMNSSVGEMIPWLKLLLSGGRTETKTFVNPATFQELISAQMVIPGAPQCTEALLYSYGIGWSIASYRGHYFVSHDGISDGFTSTIGFLPLEDVAFFIVANRNMTPLPRYLSFQMIDAILKLPFHDWLKEGKEAVGKNRENGSVLDNSLRKKGTSPSHALKDYVGVYEHPGYGTLVIDWVDNKLRMIYNDLEFVLDHWHYDVFVISESKQSMIIPLVGTKCHFHNDPSGEIESFYIPLEGAIRDIAFKKKASGAFTNLPYLKRFTGSYKIFGYVVEIALRGDALYAIIAGQPNYELVPCKENEFSVKTMTGALVRFVLDKNQKCNEVLLIYPYGSFSAKRIL